MMKKVLSLVLVLTLVLALAVPAFAAEEDDVKLSPMSITINNALQGYDYTVYEILKVATYDATLNAYRYVTIDGLDSAKLLALSATVDGATHTVGEYLTTQAPVAGAEDVQKEYIVWKDGVGTEAGAQQLAQILKANRDVLEAAKNGANKTTKKAESSTVKFENLEAGYYLVDSEAGVLCGMDTAQKVGDSYDVQINEKNEVPSIDKDVKENNKSNNNGKDEDWREDKNHADIGDTVEFRVVISAKKGAENYVLHDTMSEGLTWLGTVKVVEVEAGKGEDPATYNAEGAKVLTAGEDYELVSTTTDGHTFDVKFTETYLDKTFGQTGSVKKDIVVLYSARVNEKAKIDAANPNTAKLTFGEKHETAESTTNTWTFDFNVYKYGTNANNSENKPLADAHFTLYRVETANEDGTKTYSDEVKFDAVDGRKHYRADSDKGTVTDLETDAEGKFLLTGLDAGTYYLKETKAPAGYNLLDRVITVVIDENGKVTFDGVEHNESGKDVINIENKTGTELPSTGGIGTTIFYVIGGLLVCAAVVLLVTKKKVNN